MSRSDSADPPRTQQLVAWSSWLWHLLNTQRVPSSILGAIIFSCSGAFSVNTLAETIKIFRSWARSYF
ncbi:hypothetical protein KL918_002470 [Ogataea parapolymorpha]|nr:hypothetical protein KL918_002470 [Ogataea parapolymorpha]